MRWSCKTSGETKLVKPNSHFNNCETINVQTSNTWTGVARINISRLSRDSPGVNIIWLPWPPVLIGRRVVVSLVTLPCCSSGDGAGANMKYIMITIAGTPNINDHKNEVRHL